MSESHDLEPHRMDPSLERYAHQRRTPEAAASYNTKYERYWHKRRSDARERRVIAAALAHVKQRPATILDMPCGAGRLTTELLPLGARITACDYSDEQLSLCAERHAGADVTCQQASCFALPFADQHFDLAFSVRLSHHIGTTEDRERYLLELFRVTRTTVIATFFDTDSLKNRIRELRRRVGVSKKRSKFTMSLPRLREIAAREGWQVTAALPISRLFSGHRYVVFQRQ